MSDGQKYPDSAIETAGRFALRELPDSYPSREWKRLLTLDGAPTSSIVNGIEISGQYPCGNLFVLATNYDFFDAVNHWFYLIDGQGSIWDGVSLPYQFGMIEQVGVESPVQMNFSFFGDPERWALRICQAEFWRSAAMTIAHGLRTGRFVRRTHRLSLMREST